MLWKKAARKWRGKGYTLDDIADKIEAEFGSRRRLSRTTVGILANTEKEEVPPDVLAFLENLPVIDQRKWAAYVRETAHEGFDETREPGAEQPETFEAAGAPTEDSMSTIGSKLDTLGSKLDAVAGQTEAKLDTTHGKLDTVNAGLDALGKKIDTLPTPPSAEEVAQKVVATMPGPRAFARAMLYFTVPWLAGFGCLLVLAVALVIVAFQRQSVSLSVSNCPPTVSASGGVLDLGQLSEALRHIADIVPYVDAPPRKSVAMGERKVGEPMPHHPLPYQATGTCRPGTTSLFGACWQEVAGQKPPCLPGYFSYEGACYSPVTAHPEQPVGASPQ